MKYKRNEQKKKESKRKKNWSMGGRGKMSGSVLKMSVTARWWVEGAGVMGGNETRAHQQALQLVGGWKGPALWVEETQHLKNNLNG